jgi:hypothetical protein
VNWINLTQNMEQWRALVSTVRKFRTGNLLTRSATISFLRTLCHETILWIYISVVQFLLFATWGRILIASWIKQLTSNETVVDRDCFCTVKCPLLPGLLTRRFANLCIMSQWGLGMWIGFIGLRIGTGGGLLWTRLWTFGFHKMRGISRLAELSLSFLRRTLLHGVS